MAQLPYTSVSYNPVHLVLPPAQHRASSTAPFPSLPPSLQLRGFDPCGATRMENPYLLLSGRRNLTGPGPGSGRSGAGVFLRDQSRHRGVNDPVNWPEQTQPLRTEVWLLVCITGQGPEGQRQRQQA